MRTLDGRERASQRADLMRVLHAISGLDPVGGGPATVIRGLASAQAAAGMDVSVVSTFAPGTDLTALEELRSAGVQAYAIGPASGLLFTHPELKSTLDRLVGAADIVHVHAMWEDIQHQASRAALARGVPYVITPHGMLDPWSLGQRWLKKRLYLMWRMRRNLDRAAAIHFTSQTECDLVASLRIRARAIVEPIGADLKEFADLPQPGTFRQRYPQLGPRPYVLYLGRLHQRKGLELLIPAFARIRANDAMLVLAGPDSRGFKAQAEQMVRDNHLEDRVIFTGMLRGAERVAALADAMLLSLPSYHENFGLSVIEALAAGVPVVVSDQVYIHGEITAAKVGGVVPLDVEALAAELSRWLGDEQLRREAAERARPFVWERYDWRKIAERWRGHYQSLLA